MVKQFVDGPDADERYAREVTALRLAARAETPVVPALLATDPAERVRDGGSAGARLAHPRRRRAAADHRIGDEARLALKQHAPEIRDRIHLGIDDADYVTALKVLQQMIRNTGS